LVLHHLAQHRPHRLQDDCRRLAREALAIATSRRLEVAAAFVSWTLAQLDLAEGQPAVALDRLLGLVAPSTPPATARSRCSPPATWFEAVAHADRLTGWSRW
jgi:hypothetical protein